MLATQGKVLPSISTERILVGSLRPEPEIHMSEQSCSAERGQNMGHILGDKCEKTNVDFFLFFFFNQLCLSGEEQDNRPGGGGVIGSLFYPIYTLAVEGSLLVGIRQLRKPCKAEEPL